MKFVTSLAFNDPAHVLAISRACDEAGFDAVALPDHVIHPQRLATPYPYTEDGAPRWEPFTPWLDPWVTAGAVAAATRSLRVLTSIFVLPMRNPFLVAKAVASAAVLSGDRVALGIGVGWMREEFELLGQAFARRGRRADEMIQLLRKLWAGGWVEHRGEFYAFDALEMSPVPAQPVPIYSGGLSEPALHRAATLCDGWISDLHTTEELRAIAGKLQRLREAGPRADRPFALIAACKDAFDLDGYRRLADLGVTHLQTQPWIFYGAGPGDLEKKCEGVRRFGEDVIARMPSGPATD